MNKQRAYNKKMEKINLVGTTKQRRKKYKEIVRDLGSRNITLSDIANGLGDKEKGFLDMMDKQGMTMDEATVLQQYAKAITNQDTRAAEFLRDTAGEKPSTQLHIDDDRDKGINKMSIEELVELRDLLKAQNKGE